MQSSPHRHVVRPTISPSIFVIPLAAILSMSCPAAPPSPAQGERPLREYINEQSKERIKLVKFVKTDGVSGERDGMKIYAMDFEAEIEFVEDCRWHVGNHAKQLSFMTSRLPPPGPPSIIDMMAPDFPTAKKGERGSVVGNLSFLNKESGWVLDRVNLTKVKIPEGERMKAVARYESVSCSNNLVYIAGAARIWSILHKDVFPPDVLTMSEQLATPSILVCPSDKSKTEAESWSEFSPQKNLSYKFLKPNGKENEILDKVAFECPIHGHQVLGNATLKEARKP